MLDHLIVVHNVMLIIYKMNVVKVFLIMNLFLLKNYFHLKLVEENYRNVVLIYYSYHEYLLDDQYLNMKQVSLHIVVIYHFQRLIMHLLNDIDVIMLIENYNFVQQLHHLYMVQQLLLKEMNVVIHHEHIQQHKHQDQILNRIIHFSKDNKKKQQMS